jgi:DNA-directed RNA polymerase specialized sigma54-like protein
MCSAVVPVSFGSPSEFQLYCNYYGCSYDEQVALMKKTCAERMLFGIDRSDERKMALALLVYNVKNQCEYTYPQMKKIFNKDESALWRYYSIVDSLPPDPKTEFDKKLSSYSKKVNILITQRKLKSKK